jgi:hypothetical protein
VSASENGPKFAAEDDENAAEFKKVVVEHFASYTAEWRVHVIEQGAPQ